jgi:putative hydrolase
LRVVIALGAVADDEAPDPFSNPLFAHFKRAMASQGPLQWDVARQTALMTATQGVAEHNVDPQRRMAIESLAPIVAMRVAEATGGDTTDPARLEVVNRATWVQTTLEAWKPYFESLARALSGEGSTALPGEGSTALPGDDDSGDAMMAMLANVSKLIAPSMLGMSVGNLVGRLAVHTFGQYDLPLPREPHGRLLVVGGNIDAFADEWSIPRDDMAIWALAHELTNHAVFSAGHLRLAVKRLVSEFAGGFRADPGTFSESISRLDVSSGDPMKMLDSLLSDPTVLLGASRSGAQDRVAPMLDAAVTAIVGYVDHCVDVVAARVLGDAARISEAVRRRRVAGGSDRLFVERLLGVDLTRDRVALAHRFVTGVLDRAGEAGLAQLIGREGSLPTPAELEAPGLWLARLETSA